MILWKKYNKKIIIFQGIFFNKKIYVELSINIDEDIRKLMELDLFKYPSKNH